MPTLTPAELIETFELLPDWDDRYAYLIDLGKELPPLDPTYKTEPYRVQGCISQVWLVPRTDPSTPRALRFDADSDSTIVRGLVGLLHGLLDGLDAQAALAIDIRALFEKLHLESHISVNRRNGFYAMVQRIHAQAEALNASA